MSFGTETSFYSDLMSEWQDQGPDPDLYGAMTVTEGSLRPSAVFAEFVHYLRKINKKV